MSKHSRRHEKARMIRAAARIEAIYTEAAGVDWIEATEKDGPEKPKRFSMLAYTGGPLILSGFYRPVVIDLAGLTAKAPVPTLRDHDLSRVVGHADEVELGESSVRVAGVISGAGPDAAEVVASAARGFPWKASVGARPDKMEFVGEGVTVKVNGRTFTGPLYVARKATLGEISFVALGADRKASAKVAASCTRTAQHEEKDMEFNEWIEAMGLVPAELREDQVQKLRAKYDAEVKAAATKAGKPIEGNEQQDPPKIEPPQFDIQAIGVSFAQFETGIEATAVEYNERIDAVKLGEIKLGGRKAALELKAKALEEKWCPVRFDTELLKARANFDVALIRAERPKGPAIHSSSRDFKPAILEAAMCLNAGSCEEVMVKQYGEQVIEAAAPLRRIGLKEAIHLVCAMDGRQPPPFGASYGELIQAAFSTASLPTLLSNVGHKTMWEAYQAVPSVAVIVARKLTTSDFKTHTGVKLTADGKMQEVGADGELKHGTVGDRSYTYAVKTYGRMFGITRQMLINDDLGAFAEIPRVIGRGAALTREELFWTLVLANTNSFFDGANANLITPVLDSVGLGTAAQTLEDQKDEEGNPILIMGRYLVVPTNHRVTAEELYRSLNISPGGGNTKVKQPDKNIWAGRYEPLISPYLNNTTFHASASATAWYLFADPADIAAFGIAYLNGQENPTVEEVPLSGEFLGKAWRGYIDLGVCQIDPCGAVKSTGAG